MDGDTELVKAGMDLVSTDFVTLVGPLEETLPNICVLGFDERTLSSGGVLGTVGLKLEDFSLVVLELLNDAFVNRTRFVEVKSLLFRVWVCERSNSRVTEFVGIGGGGG